MSRKEAISEVFVTAFKSLSQQEKEFIVEKLLSDLKLREDIVDIVTYLQRQKEKSIPYEKVRKELKEVGRI
ncbi:MAG: hypothetical protein AB1633_11180 [Elusimicrobiota bacterium]